MTRFEKTLKRGEEIVALALIAAITLILACQIIFRYFLNSPLSWTGELVQFLIICLTFIAATAVLKRSEHYSIDIFVNMLSARSRYFVGLLTDAVQLTLVIGLAYYSYRLALVYAGTSSVVLRIPEEVKAFVMFYCFLSMAFHFLMQLGRSLMTREG